MDKGTQEKILYMIVDAIGELEGVDGALGWVIRDKYDEGMYRVRKAIEKLEEVRQLIERADKE